MKITTTQDIIAGGKVYHPTDGAVEVPDDVAKAEGYAPADADTTGDAPTAPKPLEEMKAGELLTYAKQRNLAIGDLKAQHGAEKILAAIKEAEAKAASASEPGDQA